MKNERFLYLILSIILLVPCLLTSLSPDNSASIELRPIQDLPSFPTSFIDIIIWPRKINNYVEDHLFLRGFIIKNVSKILYNYGISVSKEVLLGQDGWLFLSINNDVIDKYRGIKNLSAEEADNWINVMSSRADILRKRGIDCWLIIVPDKSTVYPEYLPEWCTKLAPSFTDTLCQRLKEQQSIKYIDLRPVLTEAASKTKVYYKYDTHWNDYGSYIAYNYIIQRINKDLRLSPVEMNNVHFIHKNKSDGDLARLLSLNDLMKEDTENAEILNTKVIYKKVNQDWTSFMKDGFAVATSNPSCRAFILCDSFVMGHMDKYLQETFSYTYFKHHISMDFDEDLILQHNPDVVLYIVVERLIPSKLPSHSR